MRLCDNPYTVPTIDIDECIGLSLATINANVQVLKDEYCLNNSELAIIETSFNTLSSNLISLSALSPGIAKAHVVFNGTRNTAGDYIMTGNRFLYSSYGVASVSSNRTGTYSLSFTRPFSNTNYTLIGTSMETMSGGRYTWLQPTTYATASAVINIHSNTDNVATLANTDYISVLIYNN
jgi:hypothetical protein